MPALPEAITFKLVICPMSSKECAYAFSWSGASHFTHGHAFQQTSKQKWSAFTLLFIWRNQGLGLVVHWRVSFCLLFPTLNPPQRGVLHGLACFSITHYNAMTSLCKTVPTPCSSHLQEAEFLKETYQEFCGFRHKVGVDLTHAVSLLLSLMDSSHLQGFYKHIYIHFDYKW